MRRLKTSPRGIPDDEAASRLAELGPNAVAPGGAHTALATLGRQFRSPLVLMLVFAAVVSAAVGEAHSTIIIAIIVLASCLLGFFQEYGASQAAEKLKQRLAKKSVVLRNGRESTVDASQVVPGDVLLLTAGSLIPADGLVLAAHDFNVSESMLTGETFPVVKTPGTVEAEAPVPARSNCVYAGTSVRSGTASVLAVATGRSTEFSSIASSLERRIPETEFARGIRRFGMLMTEIMFVMVVVVFFANAMLGRPLTDSLLFSLALAVGLTPELLPAIISVTLARGARTMAASGVIVRRLESIENLGSMDVLCTDKTGTLTKGEIHLDAWLNVEGVQSNDVLLLARLNANLQSGMRNPLDEAVSRAAVVAGEDDFSKVDEIPYDFVRRRLSVVAASQEGGVVMICKGALENVLDVCTKIRTAAGDTELDPVSRTSIETRFRDWSEQGYRVLAVASRRLTEQAPYTRDDEEDLRLEGFLLFLDPAKPGVADRLSELEHRGISVKMISGDNRFVAAHLARSVGLNAASILTGKELRQLSSGALAARAPLTDVFAEIDPNQKESIVRALRARGHVVGYLGDGINDAPALHEADVGISVDSAVDVAREAADVVLLQQDLGVLVRGVDDGRATFANTMKYISITTSANFGNMISMAVASLALPFLPLLAQQVLLNNFLSDIPSFAIATDNVDEEDRKRPRHWDIAAVRQFMLTFGLVSSFFDLLTFAFLIFVVGAGEERFQTAWFIESLLTELLIVFVVRTRKRFWLSRPARLLICLTALVTAMAIALPFVPGIALIGFEPLPLPLLLGILAITALYLLASEATKHWYFQREDGKRGSGQRKPQR